MKKIIITVFFLIFFLTGCISPSDSNIVKEGEKKISEIQQENYFDDSRWETIVDSPNKIYFLLPELPSEGFVRYKQDDDKKIYIDFRREKIEEFNKYDILYSYIVDYIYNDYIFNDKYENNLGDFFSELNDMNIDFYFDDIPVYTWSDVSDDLYNSNYSTNSGNASNLCPSDGEITYDDLDKYTSNGESLEDVDYFEIVKESGCKPELLIYLKEENLEENNITLEEIEEISKEYYDSENLTLSFSYLESGDHIVDSNDEYVVEIYKDDRGYRYRTLDSSVDVGALDNWYSRYNF